MKIYNTKKIHLYLKVLIITLNFICITSCEPQKAHTRLSNIQRIENDLTKITKTEKARNYQNIKTLNFVAKYIFDELSKTCDTVFYQKYLVNDIEYKNVIGKINTKSEQDKIIIGAHV